jgi:hypothetical protein
VRVPGHIDKYNMQSGRLRGSARWSESARSAHDAAVTLLACDPLNRFVVSAALDSRVRWWRLRDMTPVRVACPLCASVVRSHVIVRRDAQLAELSLGAAIALGALHHGGQLLALVRGLV